MATIKFFQCGDLHDVEKYIFLKNFARTIPGLSAIIHVGDYFSGENYVRIYQESIGKTLSKILGSLSKDDLEILKLAQIIQQAGGVEGLINEYQSAEDMEVKNQIIQIIDFYNKSREKIPEALKKHHDLLEDNKEEIKAANKKSLELVLQYAEKEMELADGMLEKTGIPVLSVAGNHDLAIIYQNMPYVHWLDKKGPRTINGVRFAGVQNWHERLPVLPKELYAHMEIDPTQEMLEGSEIGWDEFYKKNPVYQRLKNEEFDFLIAHKGFDSFAESFGHGLGGKKIIEIKKPKAVLCGHLHGKGLFDDSRGYSGLRSSDKYAYLIRVDDESKQIVNVEVYEWVGGEIK